LSQHIHVLHRLNFATVAYIFLLFLPNEILTDCLFDVTAFWPFPSSSTDPFVSGDLVFDPVVCMIPVAAV
jgi:hypothetical protein